jgi:hypothetical protein
MCNCCNGVGHEFVARGMKCRIVIRDGVMSIYLPNNATDLDVKSCPLCGRKLNRDDVDQTTESSESWHDAGMI